MTPQKKAEIRARFDAIVGPRPKPKPKVVVSGGRPIRDVVVGPLSPEDPNNISTPDGIVRVVRDDFVTINMREYEAQRLADERAQERDRHHRRQLDPYRLGLW